MTRSKLVPGVLNKVRVIEGYKNYRKLYVKRTKQHTYIVSTSPVATLNSMIEIDGEFHFFPPC